MKYMITAAVALSLLAGGAAMAQDDHRGGPGGRGGGGEHREGGPPGGGRGGGGPQGAVQAQPQGQPQNVPHNRAGQEVFQGERRGGPPPQQNFDRGRGPNGPQNGGPQNGGPQNFDRGRDNRDNRGGDNRGGDRHDYGGNGGRPDYRPGPGSSYRPGGYLRDRGWHGGQRFRLAPYRYPRGFGYQTWAFGAFLPSVYLAPDYTLFDYWAYALPAPPPGYHWIRVGPDALLVRYGDGYVLDAAYGLFY